MNRVYLFALFAFLIFSCGQKEPEQRSSSTAGVSTVHSKAKMGPEAPMLARLVAEGKLPALSERLPENPLVVTPLGEIGTYGGTIRRALTGDIVQVPGVNKTINELLMGFERPFPRSIEPNLVESYAFEDEGRTAVFRLRKGLKWSDGHPFTADDILFLYDDTLLDENARQGLGPPSSMLIDGEPARIEKMDDLTFRVSAKKPMGQLLAAFSRTQMAYPKHVLSKWHPKYNPEATYEDFRERTTTGMLMMTPGIPAMSAWIAKEWIRGQYLLYERNPYYWKVDTAGNQLPYADNLRFTVIQNSQVILLKFINGEIDLFGRYARNDMVATLRSEEPKGKFKLRFSGPGEGPTFYLNWDSPKPKLREAFRNRNVRIALSHAVNREEVNQILYAGYLEPAGYTFGPGSPYYSEEAANMYADFDPVKAARLLDEAGYVDSDQDGWREYKDGSVFSFTIDVVMPSMWHDVCSLVSEQWQAVGLKVVVNGALRDMIWPRRDSGEFDVHFWDMEGPDDPLGTLHDWAITGPGNPFWHRFARDQNTEWLWQASRAFERAATTLDTLKVREAMVEARDLTTTNVPGINVGFVYRVWGANTRLGNVPEEATVTDVYRGWSRPMFHEQIYIKNRE